MQYLRYAPQIPFPAYAFVPGKHPHPVTDSRGHHLGNPAEIPSALNPLDPTASIPFLIGLDLFNSGYYWEAHEAWEGLWIIAGRTGLLASFLKGLIKLAAAGVKVREGQISGVQRHARRAIELFELVSRDPAAHGLVYCGLSLETLLLQTHHLADHPFIDMTPTIRGRRVISFQLTLIGLDQFPGSTYTNRPTS